MQKTVRNLTLSKQAQTSEKVRTVFLTSQDPDLVTVALQDHWSVLQTITRRDPENESRCRQLVLVDDLLERLAAIGERGNDHG